MLHFEVIIPLLLFLTLVYLLQCIFHINCTEALPLTVCIIVIILYAFGWINRLTWGTVLLILAGILGALLYIKDCHICRKVIFNSEILLFVAIFFFAFCVHRRETAYGWDEAAHWLLTVKNMFVLDAFGASARSNLLATYKHYLPGCALFEYWFLKIAGKYSNAGVRIAYSVMIGSFLSPWLNCLKSGASWKKRVLYGFVLFFSPFFCYRHAYNSVTVDLVMGLCCAYFIYSVCYTKGSIRFLFSGSSLFTLCLIKDSGFIATYLLLVFLLIKNIFSKEKVASKADKLTFIMLLIMPLCIKLSWAVYLYRQGWPFLQAILGKNIINNEMGNYGSIGFLNYWKALLWECSFSDSVKFYLNILPVPFSLVLLILFGFFIYYIKKSTYEKKREIKTAGFALFFVMLLWTFGTALLYLKSFTESETAVLSSASRYLGVFLMPLYLFTVSLYVSEGRKLDCCLVLVIFLLLPNLAPLFSQGYFESHRARALLDPVDTEEDIAYATYVSGYESILPYITNNEELVLVYGHGNIHWLLHTLAPNPCARSALPQGLLERINENGVDECILYIDLDADIESFRNAVCIEGQNKVAKAGDFFFCAINETGILNVTQLN